MYIVTSHYCMHRVLCTLNKYALLFKDLKREQKNRPKYVSDGTKIFKKPPKKQHNTATSHSELCLCLTILLKKMNKKKQTAKITRYT